MSSKYAHLFNHDKPFTLGVEEEYMLCDPESGDLVDRAHRIMANLDEGERIRFSYELIQSEIEINTPISTTVAETMDCITRLRRRVRDLGDLLDYRIGISGTHPTALADNQGFVDSPGYQWVASQLRYYAQRNITFAIHVHVALPDAETSIAVTNAARRWLAPLLALSTNSPFFQAHNTGMLSSRTFQFGAFPRTNIPCMFRSFTHFEEVLTAYMKMGSITSPRQIWWKIRPHAGYGTVEFRVCDIQRSIRRTEAIVALTQALCHRIASEFTEGSLTENFELEYLNDALWKATRFNMDALMIDPGDSQLLSTGEMVQKMMAYIEPSLDHFGTRSVVSTVEEILRTGSEAKDQLQEYEQSGFAGLQKMLMREVEFGDEE